MVKNQNLTIMFTDMKGFSGRASSKSRESLMEMVKQHKELLLPIIADRGGRLIKAIGDAFLAAFESPTDSVLAGMALQEKLRQYNQTVPEESRIEIRIAINTGEVVLDEDDVFGEAVNIASRIQGISEPNEIYFTESTYLSMNKSEVPSAEIGYRILKGIPHKIKIYKVLREGEILEGRQALASSPGRFPWSLAPFGRRCLAFVMDVGLVALLTALLLAPGWEELKRAREEVGLPTSRLHRAISDVRQRTFADQMPGEIQQAGDELREFRGELQRRQNEFQRRIQELSQREAELKALKEKSTREGKAFEEGFRNAEAELEDLRREVETKRREVEELEARSHRMDVRPEDSRERILHLENGISDLESQLKEHQREIIYVISDRDQRRYHEREIRNLQNELDDQRQELRELQMNVPQRAEATSGGRAELAEKRKELVLLERRLQEQETSAHQRNENFERRRLNEEQMQRKQEEVSHLSEEVMRLEAEIREEEALMRERQDEVKQIHHDVKQFRREIRHQTRLFKIKAVVIGLLLFLGYGIISLAWQGRSLGKAVVKLKVCNMDGGKLSLGCSFARTFLYLLSALPFGLGFLWAFIDSYRQTWHDKLTETHVVIED